MLLVLFGTLAILLFSSVPIAIAIGLAVLAGLWYSGTVPMIMVAQNCFTAVDSFPLMGLPFYMLAGTLMVNGGTARRLIDLAKAMVGWITGGMGIITTLACVFFGAISGSAPGTTAAIGSIMVPSMKEAGYKSGLAGAIAACAGTIGIIIPPSIPFVIYGVASGVSIADMFVAGIIPGILVALGLMVTCYIVARRTRDTAPLEEFHFKHVLVTLFEAKWGLMVPLIILGGIYSGIFTPTESAVVACNYAIVVGVFIYRELTFKSLCRSLIDACLLTGTVLIINGISAAFGQMLTIHRVPLMIAEFMVGLSSDPVVILLLINAMLLIVGCFFETLSAIIILTPIFLPIVKMVGVDPVHFGIMMTCALGIGFVTPPLGTTLFLGAQMAETSLEDVLKHLWPFLIAMTVTLLIITYCPPVSLFLPRVLG